jgi:hypothetical protein
MLRTYTTIDSLYGLQLTTIMIGTASHKDVEGGQGSKAVKGVQSWSEVTRLFGKCDPMQLDALPSRHKSRHVGLCVP